ncbi:WD40/YVTN/BNR-like repeat-containing protein [Spirosoma soli]|uniref:WD40/YVTN/BNR-like repeat-containing protein n=2 Tax=Spirosoma soli TaxID=1770529 RepID=A0ABW5M2L5_9BACT
MLIALYHKYTKATWHLLLVVWLWLVSSSSGFGQLQWTRVTSCERCGDYYDVTHGNGQWLIVGSAGKILTSPDGLTWTEQSAPTKEDLLSVVYGAGQWVAVGTNGTILTSSNGISWTLRQTDPANRLNSVSHGAGLWLAVGKTNSVRVQYGIYYTSPDGINWTYQPQAGSLSYSLNHVNYLNGTWFLLGGGGMFTSPNGLDWTRRDVQTVNYLTSIAYGAGNYLISTVEGYIAKSPDGINWTRSSSVSQQTADLSYGAAQWVAVGGLLTGRPPIAVSPDGINWRENESPADNNLHGVYFTGNRGIAVGRDYTILTTTSFVCASKQSGDWIDPTTWSCGREPISTDVITLNPGHTINITSNTAQAQQIVNNGGKLLFTSTSARLFFTK